MLYQHRESSSTTSTLNEPTLEVRTSPALPQSTLKSQQIEIVPDDNVASDKVAIALQLIGLDALLKPEQYLLESVVPHGGE